MPVTWRMIATTKIGSDIGSMISKKMRQNPAPSTRAALNSSGRQRGEVVAEQQRQDRHAEDGVDDDDGRERAENLELLGDDHERIEHHLVGDERAEDQDGEEELRRP